MEKEEYPSLLPPGIHDVLLSDLESQFVVPFANPERRREVMERFLVFFNRLVCVGVRFEIWIDGSFTTEKENPADIDLVIFGDPGEINRLPPEKANELKQLLDNGTSKIRYLCDVYYAPINDYRWRSYWRGWYGFTRSEQPKGFARLVYEEY